MESGSLYVNTNEISFTRRGRGLQPVVLEGKQTIAMLIFVTEFRNFRLYTARGGSKKKVQDERGEEHFRKRGSKKSIFRELEFLESFFLIYKIERMIFLFYILDSYFSLLFSLFLAFSRC